MVTHARIYNPPSSPKRAVAQIEAWLESPSLVLLAEGEAYRDQLGRLIVDAKVKGPRVHDARIAALCRAHGVRELWTADRDFSSFRHLRTRNPLV